MAKHFVFYRQDIINLLINYKIFMSIKVQEIISKGKRVQSITQKDTLEWTEEFFDQALKKGEVKVEDLLDEVAEVLAKTHGIRDRHIEQE